MLNNCFKDFNQFFACLLLITSLDLLEDQLNMNAMQEQLVNDCLKLQLSFILFCLSIHIA